MFTPPCFLCNGKPYKFLRKIYDTWQNHWSLPSFYDTWFMDVPRISSYCFSLLSLLESSWVIRKSSFYFCVLETDNFWGGGWERKSVFNFKVQFAKQNLIRKSQKSDLMLWIVDNLFSILRFWWRISWRIFVFIIRLIFEQWFRFLSKSMETKPKVRKYNLLQLNWNKK